MGYSPWGHKELDVTQLHAHTIDAVEMSRVEWISQRVPGE